MCIRASTSFARSTLGYRFEYVAGRVPAGPAMRGRSVSIEVGQSWRTLEERCHLLLEGKAQWIPPGKEWTIF